MTKMMPRLSRGSRTRTAGGVVTAWTAITLAVALLFIGVGLPPSAGAVPFVHILDAPSPPDACATFAVTHGGSATWSQAKFDTPTTGGTDNGLTVTITFTTPGGIGVAPVFSWTSSQPVDAVWVKVATEGYLYLYNPEASSDTGLTSPKDSISHITFCIGDDTPIATSTTTTSTTTTSTTTTSTTSTSTSLPAAAGSTTTTTTTTTTAAGDPNTTAATTTIPTEVKPAIEVAQPAEPVQGGPTFTG